MDWSIQEIARLAGTTSRTLRHYGEIGLLPASRVGSNGYRYYDQRSLVRLQRILLLRDLGLGLVEIARVLEESAAETDALTGHLRELQQEQTRLGRRIRAVEGTIERLNKGEPLMAEEVLDGFDHASYRDEVEERWGAESYATGDRWWRAKTAADKREWTEAQRALAAEWMSLAASGARPDSAQALALAARQYAWLRDIPGSPGYPGGPTKEYFVGLGELYVSDERFAAHYGGAARAAFVRDAMAEYAAREL